MKHPNEADLALYAGHDLNFVSEWRVGRHVAECGNCRESVDTFRSLRLEAAALGELPPDIAWNRLASEMKANIRLGLEGGRVRGRGIRQRSPLVVAGVFGRTHSGGLRQPGGAGGGGGLVAASCASRGSDPASR